MIPPANACIEPGTVVVESFDAEVADVAVSTAGQDYNFTLGAHVSGFELFQQLHEADVGVFANVTRVDCPRQEPE